MSQCLRPKVSHGVNESADHKVRRAGEGIPAFFLKLREKFGGQGMKLKNLKA
jgi:hypothetical protein